MWYVCNLQSFKHNGAATVTVNPAVTNRDDIDLMGFEIHLTFGL